MNNFLTRSLFLLTLLCLFAIPGVFAQTITIGNVDPGPYGQGSTIAVPFTIDDATACIPQNNVFTLYLSDASGNFPAGGTPIGTVTGFYATYINGLIPATTPAGTGYKVMVKTSAAPVVTSTVSNTFSINTNPVVDASISSQIISATYPDVFGNCNGTAGSTATFTNKSTAGATVTATFYNEQTKTADKSNVPIPAAGYTFTEKATNYTIIVKATDGTNVGTHAYQLINNVSNTAIGATGSQVVCLINGSGDLTINVDISSATGIQFNYPGDLYTITWGDGSAATVVSFCEIKANKGKITHTYTKASCGNSVVLQASNAYCGNIGTAQSSTAAVVVPPTNKFTIPPTACAGTAISINNQSDPGLDPATCLPNAKALYTWLVDGVAFQNYTLGTPFILPATTPPGKHTITLQLQNGAVGCGATDVSQDICLQAPPKPAFTIPADACLSNGPVTPTNTSVIDAGCNATNQYIWSVVGPAPVTYAGGTNANSKLPQFVFPVPGVYSVQLSITTATCGTVAAPSQSIIVDGTPVASMSPNTTLCGNNQTLIFDPTPGPTQTTLTGTGQQQPTTYTWVITGGAFSFQNTTTANSQYPIISFSDFATYTVKVTQTNNCGSITKTQTITFVQAPTVSAGTVAPICQGSVAHLNGSISGTVTSFQWQGGSGTFSAGRGSKITDYTPSAAEIAAGQVTLTLQATTALPAPCNTISSNVVINITPLDNITSPPAQAICTGSPLNYNITASNANSSFTWTASVTSGTVTGFSATGSGSTINDVLTNTNVNTPSSVTYKITPVSNTCTGNTFTLVVTVNPLPKITAKAVNSPICSDQPANIALTSNINNTSYTWTSVASAGITGNTQQSSGVVTNGIQDVLNNTAATVGTVTYTITPYNGSCPGTPITASVTVQPLPVESVPGPDDEVCNTTTYQLKGNDPSPGTGKWTIVKGPAGATFSDDTKPNATVSGLIPGNLYQFQWTITATPTCPPNSNAVNITIDKPAVGGTTTTSGPNPVCSGSGNGQITLADQEGDIVRWESSTDNGATWQPIVNVSTTQSYSNLTQTTQYRAVMQSGKCNLAFSSVTTITVNPVTVISNAGTDQPICNETTANLNGNDPAPFVGTWTQTAGPPLTIANVNDPHTQISGLVRGNTYTFMWTIKGLPPCGDSFSTVNIVASSDITASFTMDKTQGCGPTTVTFINTSTPTTAGLFQWDFGDGSTPSTSVTPPPHTFAPSTDGKDVIYTITLTPVGNCGLKTPVTQQVTISPATPVAKLLPSQTTACGAFTLTVQNLSPGNNVKYEFYLKDKGGNILQYQSTTDKSDVTFLPINPSKPTDYTVSVVATDKCGNQGSSPDVIISISPSTLTSLMQIKGDAQSVCLGSSITFQNISSGGDRFTYTIYDSGKNPIATIPGGAADINYTPTAEGTYYVSITAGNNGCGDAPVSSTHEFSVYPIPQPDFTFTLDDQYNVTFTNTTPADGNTPASSLTYDWDFGDGSLDNSYQPKAHFYDYNNSPFTVRLRATNAASGCDGFQTKTVVVKFLGGLYLPNAFMPTSASSDIKTFMAKGNGLKEYRLQIFNNFGELVWETTKLDSNGSPTEGWDGTFKGAPAQQGVYIWQASATFVNGQEWKGMSYNHSTPKRSGTIHLIR